jgi:hypothetical protein
MGRNHRRNDSCLDPVAPAADAMGLGLAEIAVFFDSYERRALHDLIAGTVVVHRIPRVVGSLDGNPPVGSTSAYR